MLKTASKSQKKKKPFHKSVQSSQPAPASDVAQVAQEISDKASGELVELQVKLDTAIAASGQSTNKLQTIQEAIQTRNEHLASLYTTLERATARYREATDYASVAQDTSGQEPAYAAVLAAKAHMVATQEDVSSHEKEYRDANERGAARIQELQEDIQEEQKVIQECQDRMAVVHAVHERSLKELGESLYETFTQKHDAHLAAIKAAREALMAAQLDEKEFLSEAISQFKLWGEHHAKIRHMMPVNDPTLRVLQAEYEYIERLLSDGRNLPIMLNLPSVSGFYNWRQILAISDDEIYVNETLSGNPRGLRNHLNNIDTLIKQYSAKFL